MKINLKEITIHNFMSFTNATIFLDTGGYILVVGENNDINDNTLSNGSGKSSIFEAILWCLTGETQRGVSNKSVIKQGSKECSVTLVFTFGRDKFELTRSIDSSQHLQIIKNGVDVSGKGISDSKKILEEHLPDLNMQLLSNIVILGQGLPNRFSANTPSGRKETLEKLFKADFMIEDIKTRINNRLSELKEEQRSLEDSILTLNTKISIIQENIDNANEELLSMKSDSELKTSIDTLKNELTTLNKQLIFEKQQNEDILRQNESTNNLILALTQQKIEINNSDYLVKEIENIKEQGLKLKSEVIALDKEIENKDNIKDICPTCGQKLIGVEKPDTTKDKEVSMKMKAQLDVLRQQLKDLQEERQKEINSNLEKTDTEISRLKSLLKVTTNTDDIERNISIKQKEYDTLNNELLTFNNKKSDLQESIKNNTKNREDIQKEKEELEVTKLKVDSRIEVDNKINSIIKRDFRGYLLSNIISLLNSTTKQLAKSIFGHSNISVEQNGNNISIMLNNKEYELLSGGEKQKTDVLLQLALRDILCKYLNIDCNILAVDEVFDGLDSESVDKIVNLLTNDIKVNTMYIISHRGDLNIPYDGKITVVKDKHGSRIIPS